MSIVLEIYGPSGTIDLQGNTGFLLAEDGWVPRVAATPTERVVETMALTAECASTVDLQAQVDLLSRLAADAEAYLDSGERTDPVWLIAQLDGETAQRRALVTGLRWEWLSSVDSPEMVSRQPSLRLAVERVGAWEKVDDSPTAVSYTATGNSAVAIASVSTGTSERGFLRRLQEVALAIDSDSRSPRAQVGVALSPGGYTADDLTVDFDGVGDGTNEACSGDACVGGERVRVQTDATTGSIVAVSKTAVGAPSGRYLLFIRYTLDPLLSGGTSYDPPRITVLATQYSDSSAIQYDDSVCVVGSPALGVPWSGYADVRYAAIVGVLTVPAAPPPLGDDLTDIWLHVRYDSAGGERYDLLLDAAMLLPLDGGAVVITDAATMERDAQPESDWLRIQTTPLGRVQASGLRTLHVVGDVRSLFAVAEAGRGWGDPAGYNARLIIVGDLRAYDSSAGTYSAGDVTVRLTRLDRYQALSEV